MCALPVVAQARAVAASWTQAPALIVTSPETRTRQTAAPTIARFPGVPVEVWPSEEFTYLQPARWNGTRSAERMPHLERYWREADPDYCDGEGAESFSTLLRRCEAALALLAPTTNSQRAQVGKGGGGKGRF